MNISDFFVEKHKSEQQKWNAYAKCGAPNLATYLSEARKKEHFLRIGRLRNMVKSIVFLLLKLMLYQCDGSECAHFF